MEASALPRNLLLPYSPLTGVQLGGFLPQGALGVAKAEESGPSGEDILWDTFGLCAPDGTMPPRIYATFGRPTPMPLLGRDPTSVTGSVAAMAQQALDQLPSTSPLEGAAIVVGGAALGSRLADHSIGGEEAVYAGASLAARGLAMVVEHWGHPAWAIIARAVALGLTVKQRAVMLRGSTIVGGSQVGGAFPPPFRQ